MSKSEITVLILAIVCILSIALFMIGGAVQDVDMHDIKTEGVAPEDQQDAYAKLNTQRDVGELLQFIAAIITLLSMIGLMIASIMISTDNANKPLSGRLKEH